MESTEQRPPRPQDLITDWYIPAEDPTEGWVYPGPVKVKQSPRMAALAERLAVACQERAAQEFVLMDDKLVYRGRRIDTVEGSIYCLRRVPSYIPELSKLGLDRSIQTILLHKRLSQGGLVLISGETGQGKSTTSAAVIKARLERFSSFCLTLENPPELPLHGLHGSGGVCIQTDVKQGEFGDALRGAVRCYPTQGNSILFVGEVRDPETAGEALRIAMNGHLVITSIHGGDIISSMKRLLSLAQSYQGMSAEEAKSVLSSAFRLIVHQQLRDGATMGKRLEAKALFSPSHSSPVANRIRSGQMEHLSTEIQQQEMLISQGQVERLLTLWELPSAGS